MKSNKGFTLIELLVVVLIIGILAAIALPQYQKTVMKSRLSQGIVLISNVLSAQQSYFLAHGEYATNASDLDISIPKEICNNYADYQLYTNNGIQAKDCSKGTILVFDTNVNIQFKDPTGQVSLLHMLENWQPDSTLFKKDKNYCWAKPNNKIANEVCESMNGQKVGQNLVWVYYLIN